LRGEASHGLVVFNPCSHNHALTPVGPPLPPFVSDTTHRRGKNPVSYATLSLRGSTMRSWILPESLNLDALLVDDAPTKTKTVVDAAGAGRGRGRGRGRGGRR
jgi:hypothetical protein